MRVRTAASVRSGRCTCSDNTDNNLLAAQTTGLAESARSNTWGEE